MKQANMRAVPAQGKGKTGAPEAIVVDLKQIVADNSESLHAADKGIDQILHNVCQ